MLGCDPLEGLAQIANDPSTDPVLRARVYSDLLPFIYLDAKQSSCPEAPRYRLRQSTSATPSLRGRRKKLRR